MAQRTRAIGRQRATPHATNLQGVSQRGTNRRPRGHLRAGAVDPVGGDEPSFAQRVVNNDYTTFYELQRTAWGISTAIFREWAWGIARSTRRFEKKDPDWRPGVFGGGCIMIPLTTHIRLSFIFSSFRCHPARDGGLNGAPAPCLLSFPLGHTYPDL